MKASWREKNSLQLYSTVEIHKHTHPHTHEHLAIQVRVSLEVQKRAALGIEPRTSRN